MRIWQKILLIALMVFPVGFSATAQENAAKIAVVVGPDVITTFDIQDRLMLAISSSGLVNREEAVQKLLPQIVRLLIDEKLQLQTAAMENITLSEKEVETAFQEVAAKNHMQPEEFKAFLAERGVSVEVLKEQIRAQLLWNQIMMKKLRPRVVITDQDVRESVEYIASRKGNIEVKLQEIVLPVDSPDEEESVLSLANELIKELQKGASFSAVAKEFSRSNSAVSGGSIGWTKPEQLPRKIGAEIRDLPPASISSPIKVGDGYYIIHVENRRTLPQGESTGTQLILKQAFVPVDFSHGEAQAAEASHAISHAGEGVDSCQKFDHFARDIGSTIPVGALSTSLTSLNGTIRQVVEPLPENHLSPVVKSKKGLHIFMVCRRSESTRPVMNEKQIKEEIFRQRMELSARQYMRNLRRQTYIEIKL